MKRLLRIIGIFVLLIVILGAWALFKTNTTETDALYIGSSNLANKTFTTNGGFSGGAIKYSGYDYEIEGDTMYVTIRNRLFIGKSGDFTIEIKDDKLQHVKKVFLQGKETSDTYQIWPYLEE